MGSNKVKIVSIVGTRPQFIKLAPLCYQFRNYPIFEHIIIHTGQHYDQNMSDNIFRILEIPKAHYILNINNGTHAELTGRMMIELEKILLKENPQYVLVYGDCDTTVAGALTAKKLELKVVHIEAGMRSGNRGMPEEINRIVVDHISDILMCSTESSVDNLRREGIKEEVYYVGNLQWELLRMVIDKYQDRRILESNGLKEGEYILVTIHRKNNTEEGRLRKIMNELGKMEEPMTCPMHPRTRKMVERWGIGVPGNMRIIEPVNYMDMTVLERMSRMIITDSGGVQAEAWYLGKKCVVLRGETEWREAVEEGNSVLYDVEGGRELREVVRKMMTKGKSNGNKKGGEEVGSARGILGILMR